MKIYFDENFSPHFIRGLALIQQGRLNEGIEIKSIKEEFGAGTADENWIPEIAQQHGVAITQDMNIHRLNHQWELCKRYKLGLIFVQPPKKRGWDYWKIAQLIVKYWTEIQSVVTRDDKPFGYTITATKPRLEKLKD